MLKIMPLNTRVLIQETSIETKSESGIVIKGNAGSTKMFKIAAVGPKVRGLNVGDNVFCDLGKAIPVMSENIQYAIVDQDALIAVIV